MAEQTTGDVFTPSEEDGVPPKAPIAVSARHQAGREDGTTSSLVQLGAGFGRTRERSTSATAL